MLAGVHARLADGAHLADDKRVADGARVAGPRADLTEPGVPEQVTAAGVREFGYLGGLICNQALAGADGAIPELIVEHLDRHWAVDARATILLAQAFADQHEEGRSASVVFLTVRAGARPGARASEVRGDEGGDRRVPRPSRISWPIAESGSAPSIWTPQDTRPGPVDTG